MKGFMRQRGASWELRVYLGRDPVTGTNPGRPMRTVPFFAVTAVAGLLFVACGEDATNQSGASQPTELIETTIGKIDESGDVGSAPSLTIPESGRIVYVAASAETVVPYESASDVATYGNQIVVVTVTASRFGEPSGDGPVEEQFRPHHVSLRIDESLWEGTEDHDPDTIRPAGTEFETTDGGTLGLTDDGALRVITDYGHPFLEVGKQYLAALMHQEGSLYFFPGSVSAIEGTSAVTPDDGPFSSIATDSVAAIDDVIDAVRTAELDPRVDQIGMSRAEFFRLGYFDRALTIARSDRNPEEPGSTSVPDVIGQTILDE